MKGLFVAVEWVSDKVAKDPDRNGARNLVEQLKEKGFLIGSAGRYGNVLKIRPPLVFSRRYAEPFLKAFKEVSSPS